MSSPVPEVVSPVPAQTDELAQVLSFIHAHEQRNGAILTPSYFLAGAGEHDQVELTEQLHEIIKQVVTALSMGQSISIMTRDKEITTQQAAELLGMSRPTVVRLIDVGELPAHVPGAERRKLRLADVLAYREQLRARRNEFITESSREYGDVDADDAVELLKRARKAR